MSDYTYHDFDHTGANLYLLIRLLGSGEVRDHSANPYAFVTSVVLDWGDYDVPGAESPASSGLFGFTVPVANGALAAGMYLFEVYRRIGTVAAASDLLLGQEYLAWAGTAFAPMPAQAGDAMTLTEAYDPAKTPAQAGDAMTLTDAYDPAKTPAQAGDAMTLTEAYDAAKSAAQAGEMDAAGTAQSLIAALVEYGDGKWITATGFATPQNVTDAVAATAAAVWNVATSTMTTAGSIGKKLADWVILVSQAIRDAMKLAPFAGDPAAGSIDKHLDDGATAAAVAEGVAAIKAKTDLIGAGQVEWTSPVATDATMEIVQGDDYAGTLTGTVTGYAGPDLAGATVSLILVPKAEYDRGEATSAIVFSGSLIVAGTTVSWTFSLTAAQTDLLDTVPPNAKYNYVYQVRATTGQNKKATLAFGAATVIQKAD